MTIELISAILAGFVGCWWFILFLISRLSGWATLADRYPCQEPFQGPRWKFQDGQFRWLFGYHGCLTFGADPAGLFLGVFPLVRIAHPPLFIPWRDISVSRHKVLWLKRVRFILDSELRIPLTIRESLAEKLRAAAGSSWPVEPVS